MNVTDRVCNLECVKQAGNVHEFVGPVKIVLVDPPEDQYNRRKSAAAFVTAAVLMIGANTFFVLLFTLGFKLPKFINLHIILCTIGFQFCMPLAILMINSVHGAAAPLKKSDRRIEHIILQLLGFAFSLSGSLIAILLGEKSIMFPPEPYSSYHFFSGCAALGLAGLSLFSGPCLYLKKSELSSPFILTYIHRGFGILAVIASSVCFVFGILKPTMQLWFFILGYMAPTAIVVFFTAFVAIVVITTPLTKCCAKKNKDKS